MTGLTLEITDLSHFLTFVLRSAKRSFLSIYLTIVEIMILSLCINLALPLVTHSASISLSLQYIL